MRSIASRSTASQAGDQTNSYVGYVQGMNVLAAPFLYTMPSEVEAFYCFSKFIEVCCPLYVQPTLEGVHRGLKVAFLPVDALNWSVSRGIMVTAFGSVFTNSRS